MDSCCPKRDHKYSPLPETKERHGIVPAGDDSFIAFPTGKHTGSDKSYEHVPKYAKTGIASEKGLPATTLNDILKLAASGDKADKVALAVERPVPPVEAPGKAPSLEWKAWTKWTYAQYSWDIEKAARAFISLGMEYQGSVAIFGFNAPEWHISAMGAVAAGAKGAGIYPTDTNDQVTYKVQHSGATVAVVEDESKLKKITSDLESIPKLKAVVCWGAPLPEMPLKRKDGSMVKVMTWAELMEIGTGKTQETELERRRALTKPGHCAFLIYTSGTTGNPKAVMVSHDNIMWEALCVFKEILPMFACAPDMNERVLSYLPLSHVAGLMVDIVAPLLITATQPGSFTVYFARPYDLKDGTIGGRLSFVKPTLFLGVPRVWEKIAEKMKAVGATTTGAKKLVANWCKSIALADAMGAQLGGSGTKSVFGGISGKVLSKIKEALGLDECKFAFTGAAPITTETLSYFGSLGIQINEIYGMSECTGACTFSTARSHVWGSCGFALPGVEVRVFKVSETDINKKVICPVCNDPSNPTEAEQGEICFRGRNTMMGYLANPDLGQEHVTDIEAKNRETIDIEGWLHSGDKGCMDQNGMFRITGRYKELIIGAGGENIAPVPLEDNIKKLCQAISNVMMVGDKRKYNTLLVTLKTIGATGDLPGGDELTGPALEVSPGVTSLSAARDHPDFLKAVEEAVKATNADTSICHNNSFKIQKFRILPRDFSVMTDELTPTLKLKRSVAAKIWAEEIEKMY